MLPNFFVVGAQKSGTTSLHNYFFDHPEIYLPKEKETHFFDWDWVYQKGIEYYEKRYFSNWNAEKAIGEVCPCYMYVENVLERMTKCLDIHNIKFIFIFRNPVQRAFSNYLMVYRTGIEPLSFEDAIEQEEERIKKDFKSKITYGYVKRGYYFQQVERFLHYVDKSRLHFLLIEDLQNDPIKCLRSCFCFLGVSQSYIPANIDKRFKLAAVPRNMWLLQRLLAERSIEKKILHYLIPIRNVREKIWEKIVNINLTRNHNIMMSEETKIKLSKIYKPENEKLADLIGRDLSHWDYTE